MAAREHAYEIRVEWTGNRGAGTADYRAYARDHEIGSAGRLPILGSSDPAFRGDPTRYSPEDLLVASLSACHMLWFLHLCADAGIIVTAYVDQAAGTMVEEADGSGRFTEVVLRPAVTIAAGDANRTQALHELAHAKCFVARSVNFPVRCKPSVTLAAAAAP